MKKSTKTLTKTSGLFDAIGVALEEYFTYFTYNDEDNEDENEKK